MQLKCEYCSCKKNLKLKDLRNWRSDWKANEQRYHFICSIRALMFCALAKDVDFTIGLFVCLFRGGFRAESFLGHITRKAYSPSFLLPSPLLPSTLLSLPSLRSRPLKSRGALNLAPNWFLPSYWRQICTKFNLGWALSPTPTEELTDYSAPQEAWPMHVQRLSRSKETVASTAV